MPLILKHVEVGATIHTDYWRAYDCLSKHGYIHKKVNLSDPDLFPMMGLSPKGLNPNGGQSSDILEKTITIV